MIPVAGTVRYTYLLSMLPVEEMSCTLHYSRDIRYDAMIKVKEEREADRACKHREFSFGTLEDPCRS